QALAATTLLARACHSMNRQAPVLYLPHTDLREPMASLCGFEDPSPLLASEGGMLHYLFVSRDYAHCDFLDPQECSRSSFDGAFQRTLCNGIKHAASSAMEVMTPFECSWLEIKIGFDIHQALARLFATARTSTRICLVPSGQCRSGTK